jgi:predicted Zn-dependent protease
LHIATRPKETLAWQKRSSETAIEARPSATAVHSDLANYLWAQNRYDDAAAVLEEALRLQPLDFMANLRIGQYHLQRNRCERALEPLRIASRYRRFPEAFQLLAFATEKCGDVATARSVVAAGLATFPNHSGFPRCTPGSARRIGRG